MIDIVSFIIPLYNGREYINNTVNIIQQVNNKKEIIIIDDGSTDGSEEYCDELKKKYSNVVVYRTENQGIYSARNKGIEKANGQYIIFIDQDDYINASNMDRCIDFVRANKLDVTLWSCMYDRDGIISFCDEVKKDCIIDRNKIERDLIPALIYRTSSVYTSFLGHVWAGVYSTELIKKNKIKFKRFVDYEDDQLFVYDILLNAKSIGLLKVPVYYWVTNPHSYSHGRRRIDDIDKKYERYFLYLKNNYCHYVDDHNIGFLKDLEVFGHQFTFCETIRNFGISPQKGDYDILRGLEYRDDYHNSIKMKPVHISDKRFRMYLILSRLGLTRISLLCTNVFFKIKESIFWRR